MTSQAKELEQSDELSLLFVELLLLASTKAFCASKQDINLRLGLRLNLLSLQLAFQLTFSGFDVFLQLAVGLLKLFVDGLDDWLVGNFPAFVCVNEGCGRLLLLGKVLDFIFGYRNALLD